MEFPYIIENKRYHTLDYFYKQKFGHKVFKVSLNMNLSCPNKKNGTGCIFCSNSSGDFGGNPNDDLVTQFNEVKTKLETKWPHASYIGYFQAGTNTFAPLEQLKLSYETILKLPNVVGLSIATRSDAITQDCFDYLEKLNKKTYLTIELGLQTIHESTLKWMNRGHDLASFTSCVKELQKRNIPVVVHIINGLYNETKEDMIETAKYLNTLQVDGIKIHMLSVLKETPLAKFYKNHPFHLLTKNEYIDIVIEQLSYLNPKIVIHRITGDPNKNELIAPDWLIKKFVVLNDIDKEMKKRNITQGIRL